MHMLYKPQTLAPVLSGARPLRQYTFSTQHMRLVIVPFEFGGSSMALGFLEEQPVTFNPFKPIHPLHLSLYTPTLIEFCEIKKTRFILNVYKITFTQEAYYQLSYCKCEPTWHSHCAFFSG